MIPYEVPHTKSQSPSLAALFQEHGAALYVLCCLAGFDGAMRERERGELHRFAAAKGLAGAEAVAQFDEHLRSGWGGMNPHQTYWSAAKSVATHPLGKAYTEEVFSVVRVLLATDRAVTPLEQKEAHYLAKLWQITI